MKNYINQDALKARLKYEPSTGNFIWLKADGRRIKIGMIAGTSNRGYITIQIDKIIYRAHRLAWLYMTGSYPANCIDHINGIRNDNRWKNLRDVTMSENQQNRLVSKNNKLGVLGIIFDKHRKKYRAAIAVNGKTTFIGRFNTIEEACNKYQLAKSILHISKDYKCNSESFL